MAANDYYSSFNQQDTSYHGSTAPHSRLDTSLPSAPTKPDALPVHAPSPYDSSHHSSGGAGDLSSPFDDHTFPTSSTRPQAPYSSNPALPSSDGASGRYSYNDPFTDQNAIPMHSHSQSQLKPEHGPHSPTEAEGGFAGKFRKGRPGKKGWFTGKITWAVYFLTLVQILVFIVEIIKNAQLTGSPIQTKPQFNPMIGPSFNVLIYMGARYVPCMREVPIPNADGSTTNTNKTFAAPDVKAQCPNATTTDLDCTLAEVCGFGLDLTPKPDGTQPQPNQWYRFIVPIFLHGGLVHIGFNLLLQLTLGRDIERQIGTLRFILVYFSAGIFGNVFGGNYAPNGLPSVGASGALFGILAMVLLDLLYTWKTRKSPGKDLFFIILDVVIAFVIGLLPMLDNFAHIGGFIMGLVLGICILHSPDALRERIGLDDPPYATVGGTGVAGVQAFVRQPVGFFKGRKPLWWGWWLLRVGALIAVFAGFIVLLNNFYVYRTECGWCKYLSCLPIKNWCELGNLEFKNVPARRMLFFSHKI